jgi:hypothetical protein
LPFRVPWLFRPAELGRMSSGVLWLARIVPVFTIPMFSIVPDLCMVLAVVRVGPDVLGGMKSDTPRRAGGLMSGTASNVKQSVMWSWHAKAPPTAVCRSSNSTFFTAQRDSSKWRIVGSLLHGVCEWEPV